MSYGRIDSINIPSGVVRWMGIYNTYLLVSNGSTMYKYNLSDYSLAGSFSVYNIFEQSYIDGDTLWTSEGGDRIIKYDLVSETLIEFYRILIDNSTGFPWTNAVMVTETASNNPPYDSSPWIRLSIENYAKTDFGHFAREDGFAVNVTFTDGLALGNVVSPNDYETNGYSFDQGVMNSGEIVFGDAPEFLRYNDDTGVFIGATAMGGALSVEGLFKSDKIYGGPHISESGDIVFSATSFSVHTLGLVWEEDVVFGSPAADIGIFGPPPGTPTGLTATCTKEPVPQIPGFSFSIISGGFS